MLISFPFYSQERWDWPQGLQELQEANLAIKYFLSICSGGRPVMGISDLPEAWPPRSSQYRGGKNQ
jgi:hypothetical protein